MPTHRRSVLDDYPIEHRTERLVAWLDAPRRACVPGECGGLCRGARLPHRDVRRVRGGSGVCRASLRSDQRRTHPGGVPSRRAGSRRDDGRPPRPPTGTYHGGRSSRIPAIAAMTVLQWQLVVGGLTFEQQIVPVSVAFLVLGGWFVLSGYIGAGLLPYGVGTGVLAALYIGYPLLAFRLGQALWDLLRRPGTVGPASRRVALETCRSRRNLPHRPGCPDANRSTLADRDVALDRARLIKLDDRYRRPPPEPGTGLRSPRPRSDPRRPW